MIFKISILTIMAFLLSFNHLFSQTLNIEERKLYDAIMNIRKRYRLPEIPLSPSLTYVAQTHVKDLCNNRPDVGKCNAHSWSSNGNWSSCCYTSDHAQAYCMWRKPGELTTYKGSGYEIAFGSNGCSRDYQVTAEDALEGWKSSPQHFAVIINKHIWENSTWRAIGIGIYQGFAVVWFGKELDTTENNMK